MLLLIVVKLVLQRLKCFFLLNGKRQLASSASAAAAYAVTLTKIKFNTSGVAFGILKAD